MKVYRIRWEIEVDAESPVEAAHQAQEIQRDPESIANVFVVDVPAEPFGLAECVDLDKVTT